MTRQACLKPEADLNLGTTSNVINSILIGDGFEELNILRDAERPASFIMTGTTPINPRMVSTRPCEVVTVRVRMVDRCISWENVILHIPYNAATLHNSVPLSPTVDLQVSGFMTSATASLTVTYLRTSSSSCTRDLPAPDPHQCNLLYL